MPAGGAPLREPLEVVGWPRAVLHVRSTAPVMAFVARLCDVAPDGTSALICSGVLNGTRRASLAHPAPLAPDQTYEFDITLDCAAWRFEPDHRIRLAVSSADFPNLWPTPFRGTNRVYRGADTPSRLILPAVPPGEPRDQAALEPATTPPASPNLAPGERPWELLHDVLGDRTGLRLLTREVKRPSPAIEVTSEARLTVWASDLDPADVVATGEHTRRIVRSDGITTVDTGCTLRSTETAFHLTIDLHVSVDGRPHHQPRWVRSFPRALL